jgi:hypothetical protein
MRAARGHLYSGVVMDEGQLQGGHYPSAEMRGNLIERRFGHNS